MPKITKITKIANNIPHIGRRAGPHVYVRMLDRPSCG